jgi:hypothetical protein
MFYATAALAIAAGLFYSARLHELGGFGAALCRYGSMLYEKTFYLFVAVVLAPAWGTFVCARSSPRSKTV